MDIRTGTCKLNLILVLLVVFPDDKQQKIRQSIFVDSHIHQSAIFNNRLCEKRITFCLKTRHEGKVPNSNASKMKIANVVSFCYKGQFHFLYKLECEGEGSSIASARKENETIQFRKLWLQLRLLRFFLAENQIKSGDKNICHHQVVMLH